MKRLFQWIIILGGLVIIVAFVRSVSDLHQRGSVLDEVKSERDQKKQEHDELVKKLDEVSSEAYIEKQARDTLNMGRPGDIVAIIPYVSPSPTPSQTTKEVIQNWQQWMRLFRIEI